MSSLAPVGLSVTDFWVDEKEGENVIRPWDLLVLGGVIWPGIWKLTVTKGIDLEIVKATKTPPKKLVPPTITDKGYAPARIKAIGEFWLAEDWASLQELLPAYVPYSVTTARVALSIEHPSTFVVGVQSVIFERATVLPPADQTLRVELDLLEWFPETATTPATVKPYRTGSVPMNANDAAVPGAGDHL